MDNNDFMNKMKASIVDQMTGPVLMFDANDVISFYNKAAEELLYAHQGLELSKFVLDTNLKYVLTPERRRMGKTKEFHLAVHMRGNVYMIHGKEQWEDGEYLGVFLVYNDITEQENMKDEATYYATHDKLTGLWNRDYFFEMSEKVLGENPEKEFVIIATDLAQFKLFNEILGIRSGNELLLSIAENYRKIRKTDWVFSRFAADKFALLMPREDFDEKRFLTFSKGVLEHSHFSLEIHNYIGVYMIESPRTDLDVEQMYNRAYLALESIKKDPNAEIAYYDDKIRARRLAERLTINELNHALEGEEFIIYIQPQMDINTNKVVGGETLVRWNSPKRGIIPPSEFVPLFEKNGMITTLDYHIWELACKQLAKWKEQGFTDRTLSVNISAKNFYLNDLYERITGLVDKYNIEPQRLKLEITETAFVLDVKKQMQLVKRLQARGFLIEMDDFGSGYSSLNSLKDICIDILKLDMKFFEKSDNQARSRLIIKSMIMLADSLGMPVIAEGVEEEEQIEMLKKINCNIVQGFYYSKPLSVEEYEEFLLTHESTEIRDYIDRLRKRSKLN